MGLFSFIKNAGKKLFGNKDEAQVATPKSKSELLKEEIGRLNIPITGLNVEISEMITVSGQTETNANREKIILAMGNVDNIGAVEDNITVTKPEPEAIFHVVKSGDTLSKFQKKFMAIP